MATSTDQLALLKPALAAAWEQLNTPATQNFLVCDFVSGSEALPRAIGLRSSVTGGFRELLLDRLATGEIRNAKRLCDTGVPLVVIAASEEAYWRAHPSWLEPLLVLWGDNTIYLWMDRVEEDGPIRFTPSGQTLTLASPVQAGQTFEMKEATLPTSFKLRRVGPKGQAQFLATLSDTSSVRPLEAWFQLPDQEDATEERSIVIDVLCGLDGDRLVATVDGKRLERSSVPAPRSPALQRLGLVFDRTALDGRAWLDGLRFAQGDLAGPAAEPGGSFFESPPTNAGAGESESQTAGNFNADLRAAVQQAVSEIATTGLAGRFAIAAFAEQALDGLAKPSAFEMPDRKVFSLFDADHQRAVSWLATQSYTPGLDVWDPLEEALEALLGATQMPDAILVITASPPNPPPDLEDPFARFFARTNTTGRDLICPSLRDLFSEATSRGIPTAVVFLNHTEAPVPMLPDLQGPFHRFLGLQQDIRETYREYASLLTFDGSASDTTALTARLVETTRTLANRVAARFCVMP